MAAVSLTGGDQAVLGYAGDVFNTAVYLSRLGQSVRFASVLGTDDPFSRAIAERMAEEGLDPSLVTRAPGRLPGLYAVARDAAGERHFHYWRDQSPFRQFLELGDVAAFAEATRSAELVYLSLTTLAVIGQAGRQTLTGLLADAARCGTAIALDTNYRDRLWPSAHAARTCLESVLPHCRFVSASTQDLVSIHAGSAATWPDSWPAVETESVLRHEDLSIEVRCEGVRTLYPPPPVLDAVDTTGAGDSFNAGYLTARLCGEPLEAAVEAGRRLAEAVVQHLGAIIPRDAMP